MWRNPKYYPAESAATAAPTPPEPKGETLVEFERNCGAERLRVSFEEYEGHPFVRLQVWARNAVGDWWPKPEKCLSIKVRELDGLAGALARVAERAAHPASEPRQDRARAAPGAGGRGGIRGMRAGPRGGGGRGPQRPTPAVSLGNGDAFDEFGEG